MDNRRLILLTIFAFSIFMLWEGWGKYTNPPVAEVARSATATTPGSDTSIPQASTQLGGDASVPTETTAAADSAPTLTVRTDSVVALISADGGDIIRLELTHHKATADKSKNYVLLDNGTRHIYAAQSGLTGPGLPNHKTRFTLPEGEQVLADGADSLTVRLSAPAANGVAVDKLLTFHRDSYVIDVAYEIRNGSDTPVRTDAYFQFLRDGEAAETTEAMGVSTFTGPAFYTDANKFQKVSFDDIADGSAKFVKKDDNGWVAMVQHYFVSAYLPEQGVQREYFARKINDKFYTAGTILPVDEIAPGATASVGARLYSGPQEQEHLEAIAPGLDLVVDYGWLTVIAAPLFWVLQWFHNLTGNWGWAIILVTICLKIIFFPLSAASYKSMAKMRTLGPRLQRMKEQYGDDKARMQKEMMEIYKKEKINPLGGCLPILVQIPVFIALYWVLLGSVEMRQAPWLGWITDLSVKDPYFILPIIMGATMLIQMRLNPTPPDPMQAKVMMAMPIVFTFMFLFFPAGLVLYWVVNNTLSIAQQWQITKMIESGGKKT
ncbi:membrane protein insertase YidC [Denitromonas iodatirespirans]|uniref:Membrane protein insertase YidC n=1 Tax=Denitromonas iodatirespirans TaxID=2795389 RepID=A0A944H6A0_DENI1|nr:membrane protein insertase YidC [Denitromonas iodatirespirans]MBT0959964.1 membrane protein insertase YidC [Denitromonas iodatirespirans]